MPKATEQEREAVFATIRETSAPFQNEHANITTLSTMRTTIYHALYALACKGAIPPELKIDLEVSANVDGSIDVTLSKDLRTWLNVPR